MVFTRNLTVYEFLNNMTWKTAMYKSVSSAFENQLDDELTNKIRLLCSKTLCVEDFKYDSQNIFAITKSVSDNVNKFVKSSNVLNWNVFFNIPNKLYTLVVSDDEILFLNKIDEQIFIIRVQFLYKKYSDFSEHIKKAQTDKAYREANREMFNLDVYAYNFKSEKLLNLFSFRERTNNEIEKHYPLLCFFFLAENEEILLEANKSIGTRKTGKTTNKLPFNITIVNSRWNADVIRGDEFGVRGHFALRRCGEGRRNARVVFIKPFTKNGYKRTAGIKKIQTK